MVKKHFLARKITRIYLESYLLVMFLIYLFPIIYMLLVEKNPQFFGANILFFEFNLFLSLVLLIYTYFTRYENNNWKIFILYFVLSIIFLVSSMIILGWNIYF
ncbi:MAG TPA: hypothetical protein HA277_00910 [Methanosphaera sp.]|nr:hypothetical protein [Methanosphaera sp.]HIJ14950.1 hypothetical protein [Methanosphaera sp.]